METHFELTNNSHVVDSKTVLNSTIYNIYHTFRASNKLSILLIPQWDLYEVNFQYIHHWKILFETPIYCRSGFLFCELLISKDLTSLLINVQV